MATEDVYCTLLLNDRYLPGAQVVAHSLRDGGTEKRLAVMVALNGVTQDTVAELKKLYDYVIPVDPIYSPIHSNLQLMNRLDLYAALTKINLWKQTQFRKVVYVDADVVAIRVPDELFDLDVDFAAAPDHGWPDCFNSGVMVAKPNMEAYYKLLEMAGQGATFDGADQGLLNQHFENWYRLSFTYNCTIGTNLAYQYAPAFNHYGNNVSMAHFIGDNKPWDRLPSLGYTPPSVRPNDKLSSHWWAVWNKHYGKNPLDYINGHYPPSVYSGLDQKDQAYIELSLGGGIGMEGGGSIVASDFPSVVHPRPIHPHDVQLDMASHSPPFQAAPPTAPHLSPPEARHSEHLIPHYQMQQEYSDHPHGMEPAPIRRKTVEPIQEENVPASIPRLVQRIAETQQFELGKSSPEVSPTSQHTAGHSGHTHPHQPSHKRTRTVRFDDSPPQQRIVERVVYRDETPPGREPLFVPIRSIDRPSRYLENFQEWSPHTVSPSPAAHPPKSHRSQRFSPQAERKSSPQPDRTRTTSEKPSYDGGVLRLPPPGPPPRGVPSPPKYSREKPDNRTHQQQHSDDGRLPLYVMTVEGQVPQNQFFKTGAQSYHIQQYWPTGEPITHAVEFKHPEEPKPTHAAHQTHTEQPPDVVEVFEHVEEILSENVPKLPFSAPHADWDPTKSGPPLGSVPEARNLRIQTYINQWDNPRSPSSTDYFVPPPIAPPPVEHLWYEIPTSAPDSPMSPSKPIFPWEEKQRTVTRVFAGETRSSSGSSQSDESQHDVEDEPEMVTEAGTQAGSEAEVEEETAAEEKNESLPVDIWESFDTLENEWDTYPGIRDYVFSLQRRTNVALDGVITAGARRPSLPLRSRKWGRKGQVLGGPSEDGWDPEKKLEELRRLPRSFLKRAMGLDVTSQGIQTEEADFHGIRAIPVYNDMSTQTEPEPVVAIMQDTGTQWEELKDDPTIKIIYPDEITIDLKKIAGIPTGSDSRVISHVARTSVDSAIGEDI